MRKSHDQKIPKEHKVEDSLDNKSLEEDDQERQLREQYELYKQKR